VQLSTLGAVALVHENENVAHRLGGLGFEFANELFEIFHAFPAEFVDQIGIQSLSAAVALGPSLQLRRQIHVSVGGLESGRRHNGDLSFRRPLDPEVRISRAEGIKFFVAHLPRRLDVDRRIRFDVVQHHLHCFHDIRLS
jgi:hypothetical protein